MRRDDGVLCERVRASENTVSRVLWRPVRQAYFDSAIQQPGSMHTTTPLFALALALAAACTSTPNHPSDAEAIKSDSIDAINMTTPVRPWATRAEQVVLIRRPVYLSLHLHLEGTKALDYATIGTVRERFNTKLETFMDILNDYQARATMEVSNGLGTLGYPLIAMSPVEQYMGTGLGAHGIGLHADGMGSIFTEAGFSAQLMSQLNLIPTGTMRGAVRHTSGVCSKLNWLELVDAAGFEFISSTVTYCSCCTTKPICCYSPAECKEPWSATPVNLIHPWLASTCATWTMRYSPLTGHFSGVG